MHNSIHFPDFYAPAPFNADGIFFCRASHARTGTRRANMKYALVIGR